MFYDQEVDLQIKNGHWVNADDLHRNGAPNKEEEESVISAPERLDRDGHPKKLEHVCPPEQHPQDQCLNELSCNNVLNISKPTSSISLALSYCENGCACNPGYARSIDGRTCVQKSDCHQSVISAPKESTEGEHKCPPQQHSQEQCWNELSCAHVVDNHEPPTGPIALTFNPCRNGCTCDSVLLIAFDFCRCQIFSIVSPINCHLCFRFGISIVVFCIFSILNREKYIFQGSREGLRSYTDLYRKHGKVWSIVTSGCLTSSIASTLNDTRGLGYIPPTTSQANDRFIYVCLLINHNALKHWFFSGLIL
uniref:Uncharacterized protein n=1 Tax=Romanomermis culicivorax TaxID=13658 RepID=A0A915KNU6_ROMCU